MAKFKAVSRLTIGTIRFKKEAERKANEKDKGIAGLLNNLRMFSVCAVLGYKVMLYPVCEKMFLNERLKHG